MEPLVNVSDQEAGLTPITLEGAIPSDTVEFSVSADPSATVVDALNPGDTLPEFVLRPGMFSWGEGEFQVAVPLSSLPSKVVGVNGIVNFTVTALDSSGDIHTTTASAQAVQSNNNTQAWVDPESGVAAATDTESPAKADSQAMRRTNNTHRPSLPQVPESDLKDAHVTLGKLTRLSTSAKLGPSKRKDWALAGTCGADTLVNTTRVWSRIGTSFPVGATTAWMDVDGRTSRTYGVAVSNTNKFGSFSKSGSQTVSSGWSNEWARSGNQRSYEVEVKYGLYKHLTLKYPKCEPTYYWKPIVETGGTSVTNGIGRPSWTHCVKVVEGTWRRYTSSGSAYSNSSAVNISGVIGMDLSVSRQYSNSQSLNYAIKTSKPKMLCGNNDEPSRAGSIMEKFK